MEKTEMMKQFEKEMIWSLEQAKKDYKEGVFRTAYIEWLESKLIQEETVTIPINYYNELQSMLEELYNVNDKLTFLEAKFLQVQEKAEAYDRLMSGGKKTLKELANIFGMVVAVDMDGEAWAFSGVPVIDREIWRNNEAHYGQGAFEIPKKLVEFDGNWKDSLTLPDGWEEKQ